MEKLNNDLSELIKSHVSIYEDLNNSLTTISQLDFLSFRVKKDSFELHSPRKNGLIRDNPNRELTDYDNVYQFIDEDKIILQYMKDGYSPVAILQWYKMKIKDKGDFRKISIYGKGLKLYYSGLIDWLPDYVSLYAGDVVRADLCFDRKDKIPAGVVDLSNTVTYGEGDNWSYKGFGNKRSPLFIRIYDKTLDLAKDKNSMAWLYPDRYTTSCWRLECKFTGRYAQSMTALQWLGVVDRSGSIQKQKNIKRDYLKSAFYNLLMYIDFIPDRSKQIDLLQGIMFMCGKKLKKLKNFISLDCEND